jgi:hypothetical protein
MLDDQSVKAIQSSGSKKNGLVTTLHPIGPSRRLLVVNGAMSDWNSSSDEQPFFCPNISQTMLSGNELYFTTLVQIRFWRRWKS